jgi:hypothetical protein
MGYDDLSVVDPTAGEATSGKEAAISEERAKAFSSYRDYLGKDITSLVILPVWIMQPFTMLQVGAAAAAEATGACPPSLRCAA